MYQRSNLFGVEVLCAIYILFKEFSRAMSQKFMICDLHLEGSAIPSIIQVNIVGMDESQFFVYTA